VGRPIRNLSFNATGNVLSGTSIPGETVEVWLESPSTRKAKNALVGSGVVNAQGQFSISCTGLSIATHSLRAMFRGHDARHDSVVTAVVTTAS
jgi:hypothetical protein